MKISYVYLTISLTISQFLDLSTTLVAPNSTSARPTSTARVTFTL